jgi:hypothetical protein
LGGIFTAKIVKLFLENREKNSWKILNLLDMTSKAIDNLCSKKMLDKTHQERNEK